jgi:polyhydroxyalkanoate synthesis regulator phasin
MPRRGASPEQQRARHGGGDRAATARRDLDPGRSGPTAKVVAARDRLVRGVLSPFNAVLITRRNLEEVLDDAVRRGRMTRSDAQDMIQTLVTRGARVTDEILAEVQRMLGNAEALEAQGAGTAASGQLPISDYDALSAAQVQERLDGLSHVQLRRLRDYEQRNANRKTVLERIDRKLR